MKWVLAGIALLLAAAPAVEPKSAKAACDDRCSVMYSACLKRATTARGREGCRIDRKRCKGSCVPPKH